MPRKTNKSTKKPNRAAKVAPLGVGGKKGSASAHPEVLARIEEDLIAAIEDAEAALKQLKARLEELRAERAAAPAAVMMGIAGPMAPSNIRTD